MNKTTVAAVVVVIAVVSFWAGTYYQSRQFFAAGPFGMRMRAEGMAPGGRVAGPGRFFSGGGGQRGFDRLGGGGPAGERLMSGRIDKANEDELTLTTRFGSVKVKLDRKTHIGKSAKAVRGDIGTGKQVIINAKVDSEGRLSAKSVLIN